VIGTCVKKKCIIITIVPNLLYLILQNKIIMKKTIAYQLSIVAVVLFLYIGTPVIAVTIQSSETILELKIEDAYYLDYDGDNRQDDICGLFTIQVQTPSTTSVELEIGLILPSSTVYQYDYLLKLRTDDYNCIIIFYDHAIESGYYTLTITARIYDKTMASGTETLTFDPPGDENSDPPFTDLIINS